jgi:predicted RNA-binding protein
MCQARIILDGQEIMKDVILVEPLEGNKVRLMAMFEPIQEVSAKIVKIDLMKNQIVLNPVEEMDSDG